MDLSPNQRRHLRALAHSLKPAVRAYKPRGGALELRPAQLDEIDRQLGLQELIKVKLKGATKPELAAALAAILDHSGAAWVQTIGRTLVVYRPHPDGPQIVLPADRRKPAPEAEAEAEAGEE